MATVTNKELVKLRELLKLSGSTRSKLLEEIYLSDIVERMIQKVIDNEVLKPPYISAITIYQIMYGGGYHWKHEEYLIKCGLLEHAGINRPPNWYLKEQAKKFKYVMDWPPVQIRNIITGTMRKSFINPWLDAGPGSLPYYFGWCKGYISENNGQAKYQSEYGMFISTYFIINKKEEYRNKICEHLLSQPWWFRKQWLMITQKLPKVVVGMKRFADKVHSRAAALGDAWGVDENEGRAMFAEKYDPQVPKIMVDWDGIDA